jgi:hypothetical protein
MIAHFNRFSMWISYQIVNEKDLKLRAAQMTYWINVGYHSMKMGNFNTAMECVAALASSAVRRLKKTFSQLSTKSLQRLELIKSSMSSAMNFSSYRQLLKEKECPAVPYLGIMLQDLVFVEENSDFADPEKQMLNFEKILKVYKICTPLMKFQTSVFKFREIPEIQQYLVARFCPVDEGRIFQQSLISEPRIESNQ